MRKLAPSVTTCLLCLVLLTASSQDIPVDQINEFPGSYIDKVSRKADQLSQHLDKKTAHYLQKIVREDERLFRKISRRDSIKGKEFYAQSKEKYNELQARLQHTTHLNAYLPSLDTLSTSLKFLQQNPHLLSAKNAKEKLDASINKINGLESRFQKAEEIKKFLKERKQYLTEKLSGFGSVKVLRNAGKQVYYYSEQINEYKELLKDHSKMEKKAIELLGKTKLFRDFIGKNGQLASLFSTPAEPSDPGSLASLSGLQTRAQVNTIIQQQLASGGPDARQQLQQNMQEAQSQLTQLKDKVSRLGQGNSNMEMPEGFKPNSQKTKRFFQRLEFGTNIQSQKARGYFPVTSDIGLSLGYKINDKSVAGIGGSYKIGLGRDIRHINVSHQGIGLRSFIDFKIKTSFWLSGGFEMNYLSEFENIDELKYLDAWQQSGLIGISKIVSLKTKFFSKTKIQLLWDFLSYRQIPRSQPILFRVGYNFR